MFICRRVNQLNIDVNEVRDFLHAAFENVRDSKLTGDLRQITGPRGILLRRSVRDDLHRTNFRESSQNLILNARGKIGIGFIFAEIFKWQNRDAFLGCGQTRNYSRAREPNCANNNCGQAN